MNTVMEWLERDFGVRNVADITDISSSVPCYRVTTSAGIYVLKQAGRKDFIEVHEKVQKDLSAKGFVQAAVLRSVEGELVSPSGYSLFEFIPGETFEKLDEAQFRQAVQYLRMYNKALRDVPFEPEEIGHLNMWDNIKCADYICDSVDQLLHYELDVKDKGLLSTAKQLLASNLSLFHDAPKQLIHSDLGPDNIVFANGRVEAIIDLTPEYENELYSLAHFLYWNSLWEHEANGTLHRIDEALGLYYGELQILQCRDLLLLYMVRASMFRLLGSAIPMFEAGSFDPLRLRKRFDVLRTLLGARGPGGIKLRDAQC